MPTFKLDGKPIPFEPGDTIIKAAWRQGIEIPHYCWHPGLSSPANCRMCLVEIMPKPGTRGPVLDILEWDAKACTYRPKQKPKLQPACYTPAADGMEILADASDHVKKARHDVQEFLLLNHPVDCPICDQSGECKLQDYWLEYGQYQKRMRDEPVHKPKGVVFGPTIVYDAERCVMCTRCVRFMAEVAKDPVLDMRERGNLNEITVSPGRELDGHYTFMTEHVCPVGALTTKDFRFKARVWFLRTADAVCQGCATGCNAHLDYDPRYNRAYRYRPRDNEKVNKFWMCDEGMLTYKLAHDGRVVEPRVRGAQATEAAALEAAKTLLSGVAPDSVGFVLSAQHSLEDNWALRELATTLMGGGRLYVAGNPDGYEDTILIHRDKNPNTRGVQELAPGARPLSALVSEVDSGAVTHVVALGGAAAASVAFDRAKVVTIAAHEGPLTAAATVVLPATSWAEHSGTYVNAQGVRQVSEKALEPIGASKPAWKRVAELAVALGYEAKWSKLKHVRAEITGSVTAGTAASAAVPGALGAE
jgi:NADH-quinone oxidoreductase subunit G